MSKKDIYWVKLSDSLAVDINRKLDKLIEEKDKSLDQILDKILQERSEFPSSDSLLVDYCEGNIDAVLRHQSIRRTPRFILPPEEEKNK